MGDDLQISSNAGEHRQMRKVIEIVAHSKYSAKNFVNDIAILRV